MATGLPKMLVDMANNSQEVSIFHVNCAIGDKNQNVTAGNYFHSPKKKKTELWSF